jgi:resuscitation-promoting factor RpfA
MGSPSTVPTGRVLCRLAVVGAVVLAAPLATTVPADAGSGGREDRLAKCESSGKWSTAGGNGYYGGPQFSRSTWKAHGGKGMPNRASKAEQIRVAQRVLPTQGWKAWPVCSRKLGHR